MILSHIDYIMAALSSPLTSQESQDESDEEERVKDKGSSPGRRALDEKVRPIDENKTPLALAQEQGDDSQLTSTCFSELFP